MFLSNTLLVSCVGVQILIIKLHDKVEPAPILAGGVISAGSLLFLILQYFTFGQVNEYSKKCIGSWDRIDETIYGFHDRRLIKRYVRSLSLLRVELGDFGYYRKGNSLRIVGKIVYYTTKGLLLV